MRTNLLPIKHISISILTLTFFSGCNLSDFNGIASSDRSSCEEPLEQSLASGEIFVGDMILPASAVYLESDLLKYWPEKASIDQDSGIRSSGVALNASTQWTDGILPIEFTSEISPSLRDKISEACGQLSLVADVTCVERTDEEFYVRATTSNNGCFASVGRTRGGSLNLGNGCDVQTVIMHELMHNLGIMHEHQHPTRDDVVRIIPENIQSGSEGNFTLLGSNTITTDFDFDSIMIYFSSAFSVSQSRPSIVRRSPACDAITNSGFPPNCLIRYNSDLSAGDAETLSQLYGDPSGGPVILIPPVDPADDDSEPVACST